MNRELKIALTLDERPAWRIAIEAGLSPTKLSRIVAGVREAQPKERVELARVLGEPVEKLFKKPSSRRGAERGERA